MAKKKAGNSASSATTESDKSTADDKKTLIILSFPIVVLFNIIKSLLFECFVLFKFIFNSSLQVLKSRQKDPDLLPNATNATTSKLVEDESRLEAGDDIFRIQKYHHKRAFEFISKALKIDETTIQFPGEGVKMLIDLTFFSFSFFQLPHRRRHITFVAHIFFVLLDILSIPAALACANHLSFCEEFPFFLVNVRIVCVVSSLFSTQNKVMLFSRPSARI